MCSNGELAYLVFTVWIGTLVIQRAARLYLEIPEVPNYCRIELQGL